MATHTSFHARICFLAAVLTFAPRAAWAQNASGQNASGQWLVQPSDVEFTIGLTINSLNRDVNATPFWTTPAVPCTIHEARHVRRLRPRRVACVQSIRDDGDRRRRRHSQPLLDVGPGRRPISRWKTTRHAPSSLVRASVPSGTHTACTIRSRRASSHKHSWGSVRAVRHPFGPCCKLAAASTPCWPACSRRQHDVAHGSRLSVRQWLDQRSRGLSIPVRAGVRAAVEVNGWMGRLTRQRADSASSSRPQQA